MNVQTKTTLREMLQAAKFAQNKLHEQQFKIHFLEFKELVKKRKTVTLGSYFETLKNKWNAK